MLRMTKRKPGLSLFWTIVLVVLICLLTAFLYYFVLIDELEIKPKTVLKSDDLGKQISYRLSGLELGLKQNREILKNIRFKLDKVIRDFNGDLSKDSPETNVNVRDYSMCYSDPKLHKKPSFNISMSKVYEELPFDNPDGGVWKQGWELKPNQSEFGRGDKLKIFVVMHSHNDPGWVKTFDRYFREQTKNILDNAVIKMSENPKLRFIWAETSYLSAWWETVKDQEMKTKLKSLVASGQFEIVTGGWVMNDEANCHYSAIISQMVEGHEWLYDQLQVKPKYGWAIDPFGYSPTMAFILKQMGFKAMLIQRVHYSLKKYLAAKRELEFRWRQYWETDSEPDILSHVEPFYSYDVPHTCGPDPKVCCQFDFKRLPPSRVKCPWKVNPVKITDENVRERSELLLDQYRKKSLLYKTKSLLVPLGDDFRYDKSQEWDAQAVNYQKLFDYMNSNPDFNVEIKFATLGDYFESLQSWNTFPTLSGDFFTYCDRDDHYWSGYYTSKPFFKRFERILESHLRSTEILYSLSSMLSPQSVERLNALRPLFVYARQNLALFQHHDGITGTAKDVVVNDYANRMYKSLENLEKISSQAIVNLLHYENPESIDLKLVDKLPNSFSPPTKSVFTIDSKTQNWYFIVYNSLGFASNEMVCIHLRANVTNWCIKDNDGVAVEEVQVNRVWEMERMVADIVEACFIVPMKALSLVEYSVGVCNEVRPPVKTSSVTLYNFGDTSSVVSSDVISIDETPTELQIESENIELSFSGADAMLRKLTIRDPLNDGNSVTNLNLRMRFMTYGTRSGKKVQKSGAYIFLPDNEDAQDLVYSNPKIRITRGGVVTRFEALIDKPVPIRHQISLIKGKQFIQMENEFFLGQSSFSNKELMIRFYSDIQNEDVFYTDLNGFQMIKRKRYQKIPLQGNLYPMSTTTYIEDSNHRFSVLSGQPLGATSPRSGWVDIFLDRRLLQDDQRGLNQGVLDNRKTREEFKILIEDLVTSRMTSAEPTNSLKPSLESQTELQKLLTPPVMMYSSTKSTISEMYFMHQSLPCAIHLLNLRRASTPDTYDLFVHRWGLSCETKCANDSTFQLTQTFSPIVTKLLEPQMSQMSLSLLHEIESNIAIDRKISVPQMSVNVYRLRTRSVQQFKD